MGLMKVFSGSEILALALQEKIEEIGVTTVIKNNIIAIPFLVTLFIRFGFM
mgnify:CR=1 FL=1